MIPEVVTLVLTNIVLGPLTVPSDDSFVSVYIKKNASTEHLLVVLKNDQLQRTLGHELDAGDQIVFFVKAVNSSVFHLTGNLIQDYKSGSSASERSQSSSKVRRTRFMD